MNITPAPNDDEAGHWRRCADDARRAADEAVDPISKKTLVAIADAYERLATLADAKLVTKT